MSDPKEIAALKLKLSEETHKVIRLGIRKEQGYTYSLKSLDDQGITAVARLRMVQFRKDRNDDEAMIVQRFPLQRRPGFLYAINVDGDIIEYPTAIWNKLQHLRQKVQTR